jgi:hypothetical protein
LNKGDLLKEIFTMLFEEVFLHLQFSYHLVTSYLPLFGILTAFGVLRRSLVVVGEAENSKWLVLIVLLFLLKVILKASFFHFYKSYTV